MSFPELEYNYRSTPPVVKAANLVQLWRHVLLDSESLRPQECWRRGDFPTPKKFILERNISAEELANYAENTIIIVPAEEGEEASYVERDPVLSQVVLQREGNPPKNVLSAIKAKGLEFDRVVLYKFGEACKEQIWQSGSDGNGHPIEVEYFFNKLYVATSRAKKFLFIVDSEEGDRRLWSHADNQDSVGHFLAKAKERSVWEKHVSPICEGTVDSVMEITERDPLSVARELETKGEKRGDPGLLRSAKQYYEDAGEVTRAALCEAKSLRSEGNFRAAGEMFGKHREIDAAQDSFWEGECWLELVEWYDEWGSNGRDERRELARFMVASETDINAVVDFKQFLERCIGNGKLGNPLSKQWRSAVHKCTLDISDILSLEEQDLSEATWQQMGMVLQELDNAGYPNVLKCAGDCYYYARRYKDAAACWDRLDIQDREREYYIAKAEVVDFPDSLEWLVRADAEDRILNEWREKGGVDEVKDPRWRRTVGPLLERKGQYYEAHRVYLLAGEVERSIESSEKGWSDFSAQERWDAIDSISRHLIKQHHWAEALELIDGRFPSVIGYDREKAALQSSILREFAYSNQTPASLRASVKEHSELEELEKSFETLVNDVLSTPDWEHHLSIREAGAALERIGKHVASLLFYERFIDSDEPERRDFARQRWIKNKAKQVMYHRGAGNEERADRNYKALSHRYHVWNFTGDVNDLPQFPELPPRASVEGDLANIVKDLKDGVRQLQKGHIEVSIKGSSKLVLFKDMRDFTTLRVDLRQGEVSGQAKVKDLDTSESSLSFAVPASGYKGEAQYGGERPTLELEIQGEQMKISF